MSIRSIQLLTLCCVSVLTTSVPCRGETPATDVATRLSAAVQKELDAGLFPGAVVLVGTPERILVHEAYGFAQVEPQQVPMQRDSLFDVASVTKVICAATAIGILKDRGQIDPRQPLTTYLPDHQGDGVDQISLWRLASHTSGFPDNPRVSYSGRLKGDAIFSRMLQETPSWPVNTRYQYACRNIILLSTIVERLSGQSFGDFCQKEIFVPLEMRDSAFNRIEPSPRVVATHHPVLGENHNRDGRDAGRAIGNAGLFTSAGDLSNFCQMMLGQGIWKGKRILSPETISEFTRPDEENRFPVRAFVWEVDLKSSHRPQRMSPSAYGHSGNTGISVWIDPDKQVYAIVMTNRNHPRLTTTASGKEPTSTQRGIQQYRARGRIADAALEALGYGDEG